VKRRKHDNAQLVDGRIILVWLEGRELHIWDATKDQPLRKIGVSSDDSADGLRISRDKSKVFLLDERSICAWALWTGEAVGKVEFEHDKGSRRYLAVNGSQAYIHSKDLPIQRWDFGIPGSPPVLLPNVPLGRFCLDSTGGTKCWGGDLTGIRDTVTGKVFFQLAGQYSDPQGLLRWNGQYLVAGYESGQVLVLDFTHMVPH